MSHCYSNNKQTTGSIALRVEVEGRNLQILFCVPHVPSLVLPCKVNFVYFFTFQRKDKVLLRAVSRVASERPTEQQHQEG